jgi:hypothetical protein
MFGGSALEAKYKLVTGSVIKAVQDRNRQEYKGGE